MKINQAYIFLVVTFEDNDYAEDTAAIADTTGNVAASEEDLTNKAATKDTNCTYKAAVNATSADAATNGSAIDDANVATEDAAIQENTNQDAGAGAQGSVTPRSCNLPTCELVRSRSVKIRCCRKCIEEKVQIRSYYCSKKCQTSDWNVRHKAFHLRLSLKPSPST